MKTNFNYLLVLLLLGLMYWHLSITSNHQRRINKLETEISCSEFPDSSGVSE